MSKFTNMTEREMVRFMLAEAREQGKGGSTFTNKARGVVVATTEVVTGSGPDALRTTSALFGVKIKAVEDDAEGMTAGTARKDFRNYLPGEQAGRDAFRSLASTDALRADLEAQFTETEAEAEAEADADAKKLAAKEARAAKRAADKLAKDGTAS